MPSQPINTGWDFGPVLDLIDSDLRAASPAPLALSHAASPLRSSAAFKERILGGGVRLGSFGPIFTELGVSGDELLPPLSPVEPDSEDPSNAEDASHGFSSKEDEAVEDGLRRLSSKEDKADEESPHTATPISSFVGPDSPMNLALTKKQRKKARREEEKARLKKAKGVSAKAEMESELAGLREESAGWERESSKTTAVPPPARTTSRSNVGAKIQPSSPLKKTAPSDTKNQLSAAAPRPAVTRAKSRAEEDLQPTVAQSRTHTAPPETPKKPGGKPARSVAKPASVQNAEAPDTHNGAMAPGMVVNTPTPVPNKSAHATGYFAANVAHAQSTAVLGHGLIPRTVQPVAVARTAQPAASPHPATPLPAQLPATSGKRGAFTIRSQVDRHHHFFHHLLQQFPEDLKWLVSPMQLCNEKAATEGIHVFVDASNILIGFKHLLREHNLPAYEMSFDSLALLMERRRPVAKRVFAGSHREANPLPHVARLAQTSKAIGYENNVKEQVYIQREESSRKRFFKDVERVGWHRATRLHAGHSSSGSDSETGPAAAAGPATPYAPKWVEQGVDEILHLKMCQSIIDTEAPTTMVLATGDGAEAEMSDGFLAHVERALRKGWTVELVSWRQQTSGGYRRRKFRSQWGERFRIIELDEWLESLVDTE